MLTNNGADWSYGLGVRIGWLGEVARGVKLGATYASKTYMTKLEEYSGLFADGGSFDIPANAGFGIAIEPVEKLTIAADVQRIFYGDVDSIANAGPTAAEMGGMISADRRLGASNGIGFGWQDTWNFKLGVKYDLTKAWTLRAGYKLWREPHPRRRGAHQHSCAGCGGESPDPRLQLTVRARTASGTSRTCTPSNAVRAIQ